VGTEIKPPNFTPDYEGCVDEFCRPIGPNKPPISFLGLPFSSLATMDSYQVRRGALRGGPSKIEAITLEQSLLDGVKLEQPVSSNKLMDEWSKGTGGASASFFSDVNGALDGEI